MIKKVGITTHIEQRKKFWEYVYNKIYNWKIIARGLTKKQAQNVVDQYIMRGYVWSPSEQKPTGGVFHVYTFDVHRVTKEDLESEQKRLSKRLNTLVQKHRENKDKIKKEKVTKKDFDAEVAKVFYMLQSGFESIDIKRVNERIELLYKLKPLIDDPPSEKPPIGF